VVATVPQVAPVADEILKGAGYKAVDGGQDPQIPQAQPGMMPASQDGTMPAMHEGGMNPAPPQLAGGAMDGIETARSDSVNMQQA